METAQVWYVIVIKDINRSADSFKGGGCIQEALGPCDIGGFAKSVYYTCTLISFFSLDDTHGRTVLDN